MPKKFDRISYSNDNLQKICWDLDPRKLDNEKIQSALKSFHVIIKAQQLEISQLKKQLLAAENSTKILISNLKGINSISLYMYLSEFYPEILEDHRKKIQSSKKLKTLKFKTLKEAHLFLWKEYLLEPMVKDNTPMTVLSNWTKNIANPYKNPREYVTAILIYLNHKGYLDYYNKSFNQLGEVRKGCFKFRLDDETNDIIKEAIEAVGIYDNAKKVKEIYGGMENE